MMCGCCTAKPNEQFVDLSHFESLRAIGKGGFGWVHAVKVDPNTIMATFGAHLVACLDQKLTPSPPADTIYAMKTMAKEKLIKSPWHMRVAWTERNTLSSVNSPFVPRLHWAFQDKAHLYLVMDFLPGGDLDYYIKNTKDMKEPTIRHYAAEIVCGLEDLHAARIIHHDIKPANLLVSLSSHIYVTDFGLAVIMKPDENQSKQPAGGTGGFMAPEVIRGRPHAFECDFFSYGCTLYTCFKGTQPFKSNDHMFERSALPASWNGVPDTAKDLIKQLLAFDVNERLTSWEKVKKHAFFEGVNWADIRKCSKPGPIHINPNAAHNFPLDIMVIDQIAPEENHNVRDQAIFKDFEYDIEKAENARGIALALKRASKATSRFLEGGMHRLSVSIRSRGRQNNQPEKSSPSRSSFVSKSASKAIAPVASCSNDLAAKSSVSSSHLTPNTNAAGAI